MIEKIEVENLQFSYGYRKGVGRTVLHGINFSLPTGQIIGLVGRNGQGKTTLMQLLSGNFVPDKGEVLIDGKKPSQDMETSNKIVYMASELPFEPAKKLSHILEAYKLMYDSFDEKFAIKILKIFGISLTKKKRQLSKGESNIFNFACAIATRADLTILDEPVAGVDAVSRKQIYDIILRDYIEYPRTIMISSHILGEMENILSHILMIGAGQVLYNGDIDEMKHKAFQVKGEAKDIETFIQNKKVFYKRYSNTNSLAVVETDYDEQMMKEVKDSHLTATNLTAEEYYIYRTTNHLGEELEELWEN